MFRIKLETDNAAFNDAPSVEIARILIKLGAQLAADGLDHANDGVLLDVNGNTVGDWIYKR